MFHPNETESGKVFEWLDGGGGGGERCSCVRAKIFSPSAPPLSTELSYTFQYCSFVTLFNSLTEYNYYKRFFHKHYRCITIILPLCLQCIGELQ